MATAEALAAGLPVVATDAGASGEVLPGGEGGRLVPPGDPGALAETVVALLREADLPAMGARARAREGPLQPGLRLRAGG